MEKSFEHTGFFFSRVWVNPYSIGDFGESLPGIADHPLLNLQINPAFINADSAFNGYGYINFRNSREKQTSSYGPMYYDCCMPYPWYYAESRRTTEPLFSAAWFTRLFSLNSSDVRGGITYQSIFIDEDYHDIPQGVYRSAEGLDYSGNKSADMENYEVTDRYRGADNMHQQGHFISLFTGFSAAPAVDIGIRGSGAWYTRDGRYEHTTQWDNGMYTDEKSRSSYSKNRDQNYSHYDITAGITARVLHNAVLGASAGYLWGHIDQSQEKDHASLYQNGIIDQGTQWYYYNSSGQSRETWEHKGSSAYGGLNLKATPENGPSFTLFYVIGRQDIDISLSGTSMDTSYSNNHHESTDWRYSSEYSSHLLDTRTGGGTWTGMQHHMGAGLRWPVHKKTCVSTGIHIRLSRKTIETVEQVYADRGRQGYYHSGSSSNDWISSTEEDKDLDWDFSSEIQTVQIPVFITHRLSKSVKLIFGVTRTMTRHTISDVTTAYFDFRTTNENGTIGKKEKFGERYTEPEEIRNTVSTSLLFGLTITPAPLFDIQILTSPRYEQTSYTTDFKNFQWWIDFNFYPGKALNRR